MQAKYTAKWGVHLAMSRS
ncbi:MAG: DUF6783 domain-containing protein [Ruminococcus sp.]